MSKYSSVKNNKISLDYRISFYSEDVPWICLILPFGLKLDVANSFFDYFHNQFNIITYESRLILDSSSLQVIDGELTVENHVKDLMVVLNHKNIEDTILVGYCSGAGIALAAANQNPNRFSYLILVNGEFVLLNDRDCVTQYGIDIDNLLPIAAIDRSKAEFILNRLQPKKSYKVRNTFWRKFTLFTTTFF
ncbi:alpha/beta fold hydrolase [Pseudoalteromonas sp. B62]|uniref:alpha/beta fold hydrolase n=1 Tax=Pseudoalteromonas sp. B62 TaxID=630483 RepID=UPI00301DEA87